MIICSQKPTAAHGIRNRDGGKGQHSRICLQWHLHSARRSEPAAPRAPTSPPFAHNHQTLSRRPGGWRLAIVATWQRRRSGRLVETVGPPSPRVAGAQETRYLPTMTFACAYRTTVSRDASLDNRQAEMLPWTTVSREASTVQPLAVCRGQPSASIACSAEGQPVSRSFQRLAPCAQECSTAAHNHAAGPFSSDKQARLGVEHLHSQHHEHQSRHASPLRALSAHARRRPTLPCCAPRLPRSRSLGPRPQISTHRRTLRPSRTNGAASPLHVPLSSAHTQPASPC